jgi:hypothetical protein
MAVKIPESVKADLPPNQWGKLLGLTPVVMTVIATLLAGLASSEMTKAQYERSYAAQIQSKAGDQWSFFQAKRLRGQMQRDTYELLSAQSGVTSNEEAPAPAPAPPLPADIANALKALRDEAPAEVLNPLLTALKLDDILAAQRTAKAQTAAYDALTAPLIKQIAQTGPAVARLRFNASRYDNEAQLNSTLARLYELQVQKSNVAAERHHQRSKRFFFGMLAAQMGVIISTLAMAAKQRNLLWSLAAGAGLIAIVFALYVYLYN